jgi:hypothetical protein
MEVIMCDSARRRRESEKYTRCLCLVGGSRTETIGGAVHTVWSGSKRRRHEKLTVNERMIDGKTADAR